MFMAMFMERFHWKKPSKILVKEAMKSAEEHLMYKISGQDPNTVQFNDWIDQQEKMFRRLYNKAGRAIGYCYLQIWVSLTWDTCKVSPEGSSSII